MNVDSPQPADVTIGLPVYNGAPGVAKAIDALLKQSYANFVLAISDNASTDKTKEICRAAAARDPRVRYTRQKANVGAIRNFRFVLNEAKTPFFMWAAHDDWWHPDFLAKNLAALKADPNATACISR